MLNVLEHIDDHLAAAAETARMLRPGGVAVVEVPAGPHLYDAYDEYLHHYRRYTSRDLVSVLTRGGLRVVEQSHIGWSVYPAFAYVKRRNQRRAAATPEARRQVVEASIAGTRASALLRTAIRVESVVGRHVRVPFGIRVVAVARKD